MLTVRDLRIQTPKHDAANPHKLRHLMWPRTYDILLGVGPFVLGPVASIPSILHELRHFGHHIGLCPSLGLRILAIPCPIAER